MMQGWALMSDGCSLAWQMTGPEDAPVLLLSNSLGTTRAMWQAQVGPFSAHYRVLRYDVRGHGQSDAPAGAYGLDRLGRDAIELLDSLKIKRAHFCGVSLGGMTGQWLGVHAPERIDRLVLANTAAYMGPPSAWQSRIATVLANGMSAIANGVLERWFTPEYLEAGSTALDHLRQDLLACPPAGYAGCCAAIRDMDLRPVIGLVSRPALVISGMRDPATPPEQGTFIAAAIADSVEIPLDAAHLSNIERAPEFNSAVLAFLN